MVVGLAAGLLTAAAAPTDIAGHWASGWIQAAIETGCMGANSDGTFRPDAPVTRAELAVVVACVEGIPPRDPIPAGDACDGGDVSACIRQEWAGTGAEDWAVALAWCESRHNPRAVNPYSSASGLFQFLASTWQAWGEGDVLDAGDNAAAARRLWEAAGAAPWECRV